MSAESERASKREREREKAREIERERERKWSTWGVGSEEETKNGPNENIVITQQNTSNRKSKQEGRRGIISRVKR